MKKTVLSLMAMASLSLGSSEIIAQQHQSNTASVYTRIDSYLTEGSKNGFSGAIAVVQNGTTLINKGYGLANKDTQTYNSPTTVFDIGSNTKQFTSTAILKLAELGQLKVENTLNQYFDKVPDDKKGISIHQLLSHTAGFVEGIGGDFDTISEAEFISALFATELLSQPGTTYAYSNAGYSVLGLIIEKVSGQSYEAFLKTHLFQPAGMSQTGYLLPKWETTTLARGYNRNVLETPSTVTRYQETGSVNWNLKANGGINATQNDLLLWFEALKHHKILSEASLKLMATPHADAASGNYSYGYGWGVRTLDDNSIRLSHNGSNGTFSHTLLWYPSKDLYIVYATNANSAKVEYLAYDVAKMVLDERFTPEPIQDNVYSFMMQHIQKNDTNTSGALLKALGAQYPEELSNASTLNTFGNLLIMLNKELPWAVALFKENVTLFPDDGNLWDSLGDGYKANGQQKEAIQSYKKAITLGYSGSKEKLQDLEKH